MWRAASQALRLVASKAAHPLENPHCMSLLHALPNEVMAAAGSHQALPVHALAAARLFCTTPAGSDFGTFAVMQEHGGAKYTCNSERNQSMSCISIEYDPDEEHGGAKYTCNSERNQSMSRISIEYDPEEINAFIKLANHLEECFPHVLVEGNQGRPDGRPGSFEVTLEDGYNVFSKMANPGGVVDTAQIMESIKKKLKGPNGGELRVPGSRPGSFEVGCNVFSKMANPGGMVDTAQIMRSIKKKLKGPKLLGEIILYQSLGDQNADYQLVPGPGSESLPSGGNTDYLSSPRTLHRAVEFHRGTSSCHAEQMRGEPTRAHRGFFRVPDFGSVRPTTPTDDRDAT
eukprot:gene24584-10197_t